MKRGGLNVNASLLIDSFSCLLHNGNGSNLRHSEAHKRKNEVSRGAAVANQSAGGTVEAAAVPR